MLALLDHRALKALPDRVDLLESQGLVVHKDILSLAPVDHQAQPDHRGLRG